MHAHHTTDTPTHTHLDPVSDALVVSLVLDQSVELFAKLLPTHGLLLIGPI